MYIVFEGDNNTGKSTQLSKVKARLEDLFESSDIEVITPIINIFHEGDTCGGKYANIWEEILDYARDRAALQKEIAEECSYHITIGDRSYYSSIVYQGVEDRPTIDYICTVNQFAEEPELVFLFTKEDDSLMTKRYLDTIPYNKVERVNTEDLSIHQTTKFISNKIFIQWLKDYSDYDDKTISEIVDKSNLRVDMDRFLNKLIFGENIGRRCGYND